MTHETTHNDVATEPRSRRTILRGAIAGSGLFLGTIMIGRQVIAKDDNEDDHDSSGSGGHDDPVITGEVPVGSLEINIVDDDANGFSPEELVVDLGQSVTFVNADKHTHTATGSGFDTGIIQPGETALVVLDQPGTFFYACQYHPVMTGSIVVRSEDGTSTATNSESTPGAAVSSDRNLSGVWNVTLTTTSDSEFGVQHLLVTYREDNSLEALFAAEGVSESGLPLSVGAARGAWTAGSDGNYQAVTVAFLMDDEQRYAGTLTLLEELHVGDTGDEYQGTFTFDAIDAKGQPVIAGEGTSAGLRVQSDLDSGEATPASEATSVSSATVSIVDFAFDPATVEVTTGTTVTWTNDGQAPHTASAADGAFDTGQLDPGQSGSFTFNKPGSYSYQCAFHPNMQGTVTVS